MLLLGQGQAQSIDGYTIHYDKLIGRGGFATCYDCENQKIQGPICVKIIQKINLPQDEVLIDREIDVLRALSSENHQNIIKIFHIRRQHIFCYIFMEKHVNGNLIQFEQKLAREGKSLTLTQILKFLKDIINGYYVLHSKSIIHRDLKPENLLLGNDGNIKICDFGLGKILPNIDSIQQQTIAGTPCYSAPQVLMNGNYSNKCDVYSLGITIFKLVFKQLPFPGQNYVQVLQSLKSLQQNQISIPPIQLQGTQQQKQEITQFLKNAIVYQEFFRLSWITLFKQHLRENNRAQVRIRSVQKQQQRNSTRQQSAGVQLHIQADLAIQRNNQEISDSRQTLGFIPEIQQSPSVFQSNRTLRRTFQYPQAPNTPNGNQRYVGQEQSQVYMLIEIIFAKLNLVTGFIQQLDKLKQKFKMIFLNLDLLTMKFYLIGYSYSLLLNIKDAIKKPKRYQYSILICQELKEKRIQIQSEAYNLSQELKIIDQKIKLQDLFENQKNQFEELSANLKQQLQYQLQNEKIEELKELIDKREQSYNYLLFLEEFKDKFVNWKKSFWDDSNISLENLTIIAYAIKTTQLEIDYPMHNLYQIDPQSIVYKNREEDILKQYIQDHMPFSLIIFFHQIINFKFCSLL